MGHVHYNSTGPLDMDLFNNLTSNNHHVPSTMVNVNTTTATTTMNDGGDGHNFVVVGILIGLIVLLCIFLALVAVPPLYAIWRSSLPVNPKKIERRYRTIEGWLISKKIRDHDEHCDRIQCVYSESRGQQQSQQQQQEQQQQQQQQQQQSLEGPFTPHYIEECQSTDETVDSNGSVDCCGVECACETPKSKEEERKEVDLMFAASATTEEHECPICMEPFLVGQTASWSASTSCEHVFHHSCIKEWLLRHIHCPCCREVYLLVDCPQKKKFTGADLQMLAAERKKRYDQTYFCVKDGLITLHCLPPSPSNADRAANSSSNKTRDELLVNIKAKTKSGVSKGFLATMRSTPVALMGDPSLQSAEPSSTSPTSTARGLEETQQQTISNSSPTTTTVANSNAAMSSGLCHMPLFTNEGEAVASNDNSSALRVRLEMDSALRPSRMSLNTPLTTTTRSPVTGSRRSNSIWRGVDDEKEVPSALLPLSKSVVDDDPDLEDGQFLPSVTQTDSFKENHTDSSPRVRGKNTVTRVMGASLMAQQGRFSSPKTKAKQTVVTQPFLSENYQNNV